MHKQPAGLCRLQLLACVLGMVAGFVPGISFTGKFTGMDLMSGGLAVASNDRRVRVTRVEPGSPADRSGFRSGDIIAAPGDFAGVQAAVDAVQRGETRTFTVVRGDSEIVMEASPTKPELAAIWYADLWYPIASAVFACVGILLFATSPLIPAPWWRSIPATLAGLGIAIGYGISLLHGSIFSRFRIYQWWPMGTGGEWYFQQGWIGIACGVMLALFGAAEIRARLAEDQAANSQEERVIR